MAAIYKGETRRITRTFKGAVSVSSVDASTDTFTANSHGMSDGEEVTLRVVGGIIPTPLLTTRKYYVVNSAANTFKLATAPGGTAVDLTDAGSGVIEVMAPKDPDGAITLVVEQPDGTETSYTYSGSTVTKLAKGVYYRTVTFSTEGTWKFKFSGVLGTETDVSQLDIVVLASNV